MAWHDETPWACRRRDDRAAKDRLALIRDVLRRFDDGKLPSVKAVARIGEIVTDPIVRVGETHRPEVQT